MRSRLLRPSSRSWVLQLWKRSGSPKVRAQRGFRRLESNRQVRTVSSRVHHREPISDESPSGATPEAVLGLLSRNCTPRRGVGSAFRAHFVDRLTLGQSAGLSCIAASRHNFGPVQQPLNDVEPQDCPQPREDAPRVPTATASQARHRSTDGAVHQSLLTSHHSTRFKLAHGRRFTSHLEVEIESAPWPRLLAATHSTQ
jgi:hypothetical protein